MRSSWLEISNISPLTREKLSSKVLITNQNLKRSIALNREALLQHARTTPTRPPVSSEPTTPITFQATLTPMLNNTSTHVSLMIPPTAAAETMSTTTAAAAAAATASGGKPLCLVCIVDTSGSMDLPSQQSAPTAAVCEPGGEFSRLELVQHSMLTIIELLRAQDSLIIVTFGDDARLALGYTEMNAAGKHLAREMVRRMCANGTTNLWRGLEMAIDSVNLVPKDKHIALVLQTDGQPSAFCLPMRGILQALQNKLQSMAGRSQRFTIHSCGYGYGDELDSKLLRQIATLGHGSYAYIPDGSMVGTVYVHLLCNLLSVVLCNVDVAFADSFVINVGPMRVGQPRNFLVANSHGKIQSITCPEEDQGSYTFTTQTELAQPPQENFAAARDHFVESLAQCIELAERGDTTQALANMAHFATKLRAIQDPRVAALLRDIEANPSPDKGQIAKSFQYWEKWGKHYLPSVYSAHLRQEKVNFKDESLAMYSTPALEEMITHAETVFSNLPPPNHNARDSDPFRNPPPPHDDVRSRNFRPGGRGGEGERTSMASMMSPVSGCFTGNTQVVLEDGSVVRMDALTKGCKLLHGSMVQCVVKYHNTTSKILCCEGLGITEYHPMRFPDKEWVFPVDALHKSQGVQSSQTVFNLVLDRSPHYIQTPSGIQCVTLGHGLTCNKVVTHPYFGTNACLEDVKQRAGYENGQVEYNQARVEVDPITGLVCRIV